MRNIGTEVANETDITETGAAAMADTVRGEPVATQDAQFYLNVTSLTGSTPTADVDIVATVDGVDYVLGSFTQATSVTNERIIIANCPDLVKVAYTMGGTVTDFDYTVNCIRR